MARAKKVDLSPRKTPKQSRGQQMQKSIMDAARLLLTKHGYGAFNTNRIAALAGISVGSLYQYFPGKESIAARLVVDLFENIIVTNRERTPLFLRLPIGQVLELAKNMVLARRNEFKLYRILVEESPHGASLPLIKEFHTKMIALLHERFTIRQDEIKLKNKYLAAYVVFHLYESVVRSLDRFEDDIEAEAVMGELNQMIKAYLLAG